MKTLNFAIAFIIFFQTNIFGQNLPKSKDLCEIDKYQRRDLSMPMSRIVLNFFDFRSKLSLLDYSNRPTVPINIAYLTTEKNIPEKKPISRFSRSVTDMLTMYKTDKGVSGVMNDSTLGIATSYTTEWMPHCLPFTAEYPGGASLTGVDFFYDNKTVVRKLTLKGDANYYCFAGKFEGRVKFENRIIVVDNDNLQYAITFSCPVKDFNIVKNKWYIAVDNENLKENNIIVSLAFADKNEVKPTLFARVVNPIQKNDVDKVLLSNEKYWDNFLSKVPHPANFELSYVNPKSVKPEEIRQAYYKAWVFTAQNVLPEDPKLYPYPQICTGKPSLWDEGEERAPFSAAWESFVGIQFYAYVDPQLAWKAFKGLMSLVDNEGMLGGESLPSRKAQTAYILYQLTKDKKSLREIYPALKCYLKWRLNITHWVYGDIKTSTTFKDAEFAFSALVDIQHLLKIADILGQKKDIAEWQGRFNDFGNKCLTWFWETPQSLPIQNYWTNTQKRRGGNTIWITTCLHIKNYLNGDYLTSVINKFDKEYNTEANFAGFNMPKYPDVSYSVYGLLEHNLEERALGTMEACLRDITRGRAAFAEQYVGDDFRPDGVRPSLFGSSIILDFVLLANGYMFGDGVPKAVLLPNKAGGISDIKINGKIYQLKTNPSKKEVQFGVQGGKLKTINNFSLNKIVELKVK